MIHKFTVSNEIPYYPTNSLNTQSRGIPEKPLVVQSFKKFPALYATIRQWLSAFVRPRPGKFFFL
jgi:hypothetical protein